MNVCKSLSLSLSLSLFCRGMTYCGLAGTAVVLMVDSERSMVKTDR